MDDKELADRIVACGVGESCEYGYREVLPSGYLRHGWTGPETFVRDWTIAGGLLCQCRKRGYVISINPDGHVIVFKPHDVCEAETDEWPRAINEACCEALSG
jgi:hypothetical protein